MNYPLVSIIIPTHNRKEKLTRMIDSLVSGAYPREQLEIIVIDDVSGDGTGEVLSEKYNFVKYFRNEENLYAAGCRKAGVEKASGDYLFLLDDDNVVDKDCVLELVKVLEEDKKIGMVGPLMLDYAKKDIIWCGGGKLNWLGLPYHLYGGKSIELVNLPVLISNIDYFPNASMYRNALAKQGVMQNTRLFPHNWSEQELCLNIKKEKFEIKTVTRAKVWHDHGYYSYTTRISIIGSFDQARSRILYRKRAQDSFGKWLIFWLIVFPASSIYYLYLFIQQKKESKFGLVKAYFKGTINGIITKVND